MRESSVSKRDFITVADLTNEEIEEIFALADSLQPADGTRQSFDALRGRIMATLFYEPSTRTRLSFESAMQRLGGTVISCPDMKSSSAAKGETLADTARVVSSYADVLVVRHYWDGAAQSVAEFATVPVINAGDGGHEHPTQTLCDLYTLKKERGSLRGLTVAICGDLKHGRTVHSLVYALARFGAHVITLAARGMELPQSVLERLEAEFHYGLAPLGSGDWQRAVQATDAVYLTPSEPHQLALFTQVDPEVERRLERLAGQIRFDAFYMTRKQRERLAEAGGAGAAEYPRLGEEFLRAKRFKDTLVLHPLPRVDELAPEVDRDRRGVYFKQAAYGVPVRMALLQYLLTERGRSRARPRRKVSAYRLPVNFPALCANGNCVSRNEPVSTDSRFVVFFSAPSGRLVLQCCYCETQVKAEVVGHTRSRRYCHYDAALAETLREWLEAGELAVFDSIKQAEELGYEPYKVGPQRTLMDEEELRAAQSTMARQIAEDLPAAARPLMLGIRTKGALLARRLAAELAAAGREDIELGEIELYGHREGLWTVAGAAEERSIPNVRERDVILVDDVIHTGRTAKSALSMIFKFGRPRSVRLAVLIDRGHREIPVRPNYVGKHIPSSERERVRVKLREVEQDERDKVVIYSMVAPSSAEQPGA
ncbi:MAG TPA: aspartate carbamoyltransferase [Candidatus Acidoferrales bacterium]|nr:aspartate carbamoyltransferase [Candidatus Acidoferrales bacterium]